MSTAKRSIVLTGFMGTGKSLVGATLAQQLGLEFVDTDAIIEAEHGPIPELISARGEEAFLAIEHSVVQRVLETPGRVIATGGATVLDPENAHALASAGLIYCLVASPHEIARRMDAMQATEGPLPSDTDTMTRVTELLTQRLPAYGQFPQIRTDGRSPEAIAAEIANDAANRGLVKLGKPARKRQPGGVSPLKIGVGAFILVGLLGAAAYFLFGNGSSENPVAARDVRPPSQEFPVGAPEGDEFIDIALVNEQSRQADERVQDWWRSQRGGFEGFGGEQIVEGSAIHLLTVGSRAGTVDVYEWTSLTQFPGERPQELRCSGTFNAQGQGGGQNCFPTDFAQAGTSLSWGGIENGRNWLNTITVVNAPEDAVWMSTELRTGFVVISSVVGGYGYGEWDGLDGEPSQVVLLDSDLDEIWSERMF